MELNTTIKTLGTPEYLTPIHLSRSDTDNIYNYIDDDDRVLYDTSLKSFLKHQNENSVPVSFEKAGPREKLYFNLSKVKAGIVTCGGLCPGLNNVIRSLVMELWYRYKIKDIFGFRYGYEGLIPSYSHEPILLRPDMVNPIYLQGGSILGSSRGGQDVPEMVKYIKALGVNVLFCIGGDGTLRGARDISEEAEKIKYKLSIAAIPKTIDNDVNFIERSFGFETAVSKASSIIRDAHNEAYGAYNGIALIKLMGRDSGFIAAHTTLTNQGVNFVLVPEAPLKLDGDDGFLNRLKKRLERRHHAVIVVSEGAGQDLFKDLPVEKDASGNIKKHDIGIYLKERISGYFDEIKFPHNIRYIDPSYIIRSAPANANDSKLCSQLAQNAVHGALAGKTNFVVGLWNSQLVYLPIDLAVKERKKINLEGDLWWNVLEVTGQPNW
jgi:6-phosphofructokinase 1